MKEEKESCYCFDMQGKATISVEKTNGGVKVEIIPCCCENEKEKQDESCCSSDETETSKCF